MQPIDARAVSHALQQACAHNDATAARAALLPWGQALLAPQHVANLNALAQCLGDDFRREVDALNQSLYAAAGLSWQGQSLWTLCERLQRSETSGKANSGNGLAPLNP